ncbi:MAG TPA: hypothetical protein VNA44_01210 [Burkholderiaceae bacterium]|nr:hypothetical protein [Burkholderiaceae bacterium]
MAADLRGFISEGGAGVLQYQFCSGETLGRELFPIEDKTLNRSLAAGVNAVRSIMLHRYRPLYVEVRGVRGKTNVTVNQFQRALGTVESCKSLPRDIQSNIRLHASGQAPVWRLVATDASALLELPDKVSMKLPAAAFKSAGSDRVAKGAPQQTYEMQSIDGTAISVGVNPQMCTDGRSETAYGARVSLQVQKLTLQGCAARF